MFSDFDTYIQSDESIPDAYAYAETRTTSGMPQEPVSRPEPVQSVTDASYDERWLDMLNAWEEQENDNGY